MRPVIRSSVLGGGDRKEKPLLSLIPGSRRPPLPSLPSWELSECWLKQDQDVRCGGASTVTPGASTDPPLDSESQRQFGRQMLLGGLEDTSRPGRESLLPLTGHSCLRWAVTCQVQCYSSEQRQDLCLGAARKTWCQRQAGKGQLSEEMGTRVPYLLPHPE
ncbi:unnamed protein product [Rangifer tarandus platyrhynchus]|uniref:Uncharacterized protein n=2 Tax=Rangifer tarandus platyrhynchus TaxID=3082113 RepID=A0ABN8YW13_RANTA|nr:unnamed protein product [Rangifer tarandus platyrhynchus]CAI9703098.1 unnamed protein product [Rangifer tarandus platyrhynchus]